ncbi:hypothetical protein FQR65_LT07319 [Abscondita terminalis]|nr:hypothetical protein FQR65_LT07319 [Abscondita terminalis]
MDIKCPQCNTLLEYPLVRLVQDSCGHKKCRLCLLKDESQCQLCLHKSAKEQFLQYETNHTGVITCNKAKLNNVNNEHGVNFEINEKQYNSNNNSTSSLKKRSYKTIVLPNHISRSATTPTSYLCNICNKTFKTKSHIKYHSFCGGQKPLQCEKCNQGFVNKYHLEVHLLIHSNDKHSCDVCAKSFTCLMKLNRHKLVHSQSKQYVCQQCGKSFKNKDYLQRHSIIHTSDKPFGCKICKAQFNNRSNLNKHQATHSEDKIHMCDECGKRFKFKNALTSHRLIHTMLRPYTCSNCSKTFTNSKELRRHQFIHSDVKKYVCSLCNVSFVRKDNLQRHIRNSHPGKKAKPITKVIKDNTSKEISSKVVVENPNAIKVITSRSACPSPITKTEHNKQPVINAPVKLAFKTTAFKNHYNISSRAEQVDSSRIHSKSYDYEESVNICKKILSPCSPPRTIIRTLGKVSEKESNEICQKILTPTAPPANTESYYEKQPSIIRNIKFKLPPKYLNLSKPNVLDEVLKPTTTSKNIIDDGCNVCTYTELKHVPLTNSATSVIVNTNSTHWRRRLQNQEVLSKETD